MSETLKRLLPVQSAAYQFVDTMVPRADGMQNGVYPWWHGWALRAAFEAGAKFAAPALAERDRRIRERCMAELETPCGSGQSESLARRILAELDSKE